MITRLYIDQMFRHFDRTFIFDKGLTGIIGPNESGKSLIVEAIRYALFGSKALRGMADDYKKLHVELDFVVGGVEYSVLRKANKVELSGGRIASGTKPVNEAIIDILGYDLNVFDVANACNQGNIEALTSMRPAERKAMVDQTVGLNVLDGLIKFCGDEGNGLRREADAIASTLVEPVQPVKPEAYVPSQEIKIAQARADLSEFNQLTGWLARVPPAPVAPGKCSVAETAEFLQEQISERKQIERDRNQVVSELRHLKPEVMTLEQIEACEEQNQKADLWAQKQKLLAQGHLCCPACDHEWPIADMSGFENIEEVAHSGLTNQTLAQYRSQIGNDALIEEKNALIEEIDEYLDLNVDRSGDLKIVLDHQASEEAYLRQKEAFEAYNADLPNKQARHKELEGADLRVAVLQEQLRDAERYELALDRYTSDVQKFLASSARVGELWETAENYFSARETIRALKVSVKSHLLPSLNKVASVLLGRMTGGERYQVVVDEDFEIMIDGQPVNTLSGSGKAVANLAIRIALGQILTNRVFSVFLADEVDAAMDDDRAAYTADALRRLTEMVGQVILVTHKRPETDHMFELKK